MSLYAVSVDPPEVSKRLRDRLESRITFLSDPDAELLDTLGIRHRSGPTPGGSDSIAFPTAVLVDAQGVVRWTYQSDTYRERARPEQVFAAIEALDAGG